MLLVECIHIWWSLVQHFLRATDCCAILANVQLASIPVFPTTSSAVLFSRRLFKVVSERELSSLGSCEKLESDLPTALCSTDFSFHDHKRRKGKREGGSGSNRKEVKDLYILYKICMEVHTGIAPFVINYLA